MDKIRIRPYSLEPYTVNSKSKTFHSFLSIIICYIRVRHTAVLTCILKKIFIFPFWKRHQEYSLLPASTLLNPLLCQLAYPEERTFLLPSQSCSLNFIISILEHSLYDFLSQFSFALWKTHISLSFFQNARGEKLFISILEIPYCKNFCRYNPCHLSFADCS